MTTTTTTTVLYELIPNPEGVLTEPFTMTELRTLHEKRLGATLKRDTFARLMRPFLTEVGTCNKTGGRPAALYIVSASPEARPIWSLPRA